MLERYAICKKRTLLFRYTLELAFRYNKKVCGGLFRNRACTFLLRGPAFKRTTHFLYYSGVGYMETEKKICCFFGHRKINKTDELKERLTRIIENLIVNEKVETFLLGSKSEFDDLCREILLCQKEKNPQIRRVYVRAEFPYINEDYKNYLLESCEETYFPEKAKGAGKAVYVERNCEMIDKSDICIVYYEEKYEAPIRKNSNNNLFDYQPKSGTYIAYQYAVRKKKIIINLAE